MIHRLVTSRSTRSLATRSEALLSRCVNRAGVASTSSAWQLPVPSSAINNNQNQSIAQRYAPSHRSFSSSHDDFSPQKKDTSDGDEGSAILDLIDSHVKSNRVMVYMKGSPSQPQCGFSAKVVAILKETEADFSSVNVLEYPEVREGVKKYAQWPTIPQLYVDGEFVGGCDIIQSMHSSGELKAMLDANSEEKKKEE